MRYKIFLSMFFIPIIALGLHLGHWQYQRSHWKQNLLDNYHKKLSAKPSLLPTLVERLKGDRHSVIGKNSTLFQDFELMPIILTGHFLPHLVFYRPTHDGLDLVTAFETSDGIIAINAGTMPHTAKDLPINDILPQKEITITGFYRYATEYGDILPANRGLVSKIPYAVYYDTYHDKSLSGAIQVDDKTRISSYLKGRMAEYFIKNIPNNHMQYMGTWFLLTAVASIIYIMLLRRRMFKNENAS